MAARRAKAEADDSDPKPATSTQAAPERPGRTSTEDSDPHEKATKAAERGEKADTAHLRQCATDRSGAKPANAATWAAEQRRSPSPNASTHRPKDPQTGRRTDRRAASSRARRHDDTNRAPDRDRAPDTRPPAKGEGQREGRDTAHPQRDRPSAPQTTEDTPSLHQKCPHFLTYL